jgi:hypothetical protein
MTPKRPARASAPQGRGRAHRARESNEYAAVFSGDDLKAIDRENALRILPRLRSM